MRSPLQTRRVLLTFHNIPTLDSCPDTVMRRNCLELKGHNRTKKANREWIPPPFIASIKSALMCNSY